MHTNFNIEVGKRIKKARKLKKMSMKTLGELVQLHESTVSRYEKGGIMSLDIDKLKEFARVLDVSVSYLMCMDEPSSDHQRIRKEMTIEELAIECGISDEMMERSFFMMKQWHEVVGEFNFTEEERTEIINFAKYIISKRNE